MNTSKSTRYAHMAYRFVAGVLLCVSGLSVTVPAGAHSGKGSIKIVSRDPAGSLTIHYVVEISFVADGHPASEAVATVVGESAGLSIRPELLAPVAGKTGTYEATVVYPTAGVWEIRIASLDPTAVLLLTETFSPAVDTSAAPTSSPPASPMRTDPAVSTERVKSVPVDSVPVDFLDELGAVESDRSGNSSRAWLIGAVAAGLLGAVAAFWRRRATRSSGRS